ncbi:TauD/TfdA family dioxygenase [Burkholderia ubonensis]|uniref:TauD/TfdA family dioxygenase n=1 Tax=Burkholderia ubonensis TaxID=101571 RepID=UPI00075B5DFA|nr:TauD/TfdA family dioxygenase [Burkholderia ubonensis]KVO42597.1 hypothetical protein WJ75_04575 [Burkholderia ubonensis]
MHEWKQRIARSVGVRGTGLPGWDDLVVPDGGGLSFFSGFAPARPGVALAEVFRRHAAYVAAWLDRRGALLFRGFEIGGPRELDQLCRWIGAGPCESREETSPRTRIAGSVYTASEYPAQYPIAFHNESSYQSTLPSKLVFHCAQPSQTGGATRLADCRAVWRALPDALRTPLAQHGYRLSRTYHPHFGMSWRQAFGVDDRADVDAIARRDCIRLDWKCDDVLTTTQVRPCVGTHPRTGETCWINHLYFFHHTNLPAHAREALSGDERTDYLVNDTHHANGEAIAPDTLAAIARAYEANAVSVHWQPGDVLLVDNLSVAHGRDPYVGARALYFAQIDPVDWNRLRHVPEVHGERT